MNIPAWAPRAALLLTGLAVGAVLISVITSTPSRMACEGNECREEMAPKKVACVTYDCRDEAVTPGAGKL